MPRKWTQKSNFGPKGGPNYAMVFDPNRKRTVLKTTDTDTWQWDGLGWIQVSDMGPRGASTMAYDDDRERIVLLDSSNWNTWEWNTQFWTQVSDKGPPTTGIGMGSPAMAYDPRRKRMVVFRGKGTWEWNGSEWSQVDDSGPSLRTDLVLVRDDARTCLLLFGGYDGAVVNTNVEQAFNDTWNWDGTRWKQAASFGPSVRMGMAAAYDTNLARVILFGGLNIIPRPSPGAATQSIPTLKNDTWEWDGARWVQLEDIGPTPRRHHAMAYDESRKSVVLFGGEPPGQDTWEFTEQP